MAIKTFKVTDVDTEGNAIIRDMTPEEIAQKEADKAAILKIEAAIQEQAAKRAALLERLNITEEEARILLG